MSNLRNGKYSCIEFERRFLIRQVPAEITSSYAWRILDRYIPGTRLRLRLMESPAGDQIQRKLTQKFSEEPSVRTTITNIYLNEAEYAILAVVGGNEILKYRYILDVGGHEFGIDVFGGRHEGLVLGEVEGESEEELKQIEIPKFVISEVTTDPFFTGGALALIDRGELKRRLTEELR